MLTNLKISGFKCLKSVDVPLKPLTVLIGPNDTGKSAFLDAVGHLSRPRGSNYFDLSDYRRFDQTSPIELIGTTPNGDSRKATDGFSTTPAVSEQLEPTRLYRLPSIGVPMSSPGLPKDASLELGDFGENLPAVVDYLLRRDRKRLAAIVNDMRALAPGFEEINIATPTPEKREIEFVIEDGLTVPAAVASVGVKLLLFVVTLVHHPSPPRIILLEEPENGVHPTRLGEIMNLLREVTQGKYGDHPAQVILTTHSPYLLDHVDLERDQVLVFSREADGSRTARPVDAERMKTFLDEFMLGEVWFNQSEGGLVAKPS